MANSSFLGVAANGGQLTPTLQQKSLVCLEIELEGVELCHSGAAFISIAPTTQGLAPREAGGFRGGWRVPKPLAWTSYTLRRAEATTTQVAPRAALGCLARSVVVLSQWLGR